MLVPAVVLTLAGVPNVRKLRHRAGLLAVQLPKEVPVDHLAVAVDAVPVNPKGIGKEIFMACHDVCQVPKGLRVVAIRSDVDVDAASAGRVALRAGLAQPAAKLLQGFNVAVGQGRRDHLALVGIVAVDADVLLELPLAALGIPGAPGAVPILLGGVLVPAGAEKLGGQLRGFIAGDVVHFNLNSDALVLEVLNLLHGLFRHGFRLPSRWLLCFCCWTQYNSESKETGVFLTLLLITRR